MVECEDASFAMVGEAVLGDEVVGDAKVGSAVTGPAVVRAELVGDVVVEGCLVIVGDVDGRALGFDEGLLVGSDIGDDVIQQFVFSNVLLIEIGCLN